MSRNCPVLSTPSVWTLLRGDLPGPPKELKRMFWLSSGFRLAFVWLSYRSQRRPCSPIRTRLVPRCPLQAHGEGETVLIGGQKGALLNEERLFGRPRCCSRLASLVRMLVSQRASRPLRFRKRDNDHGRACHLTKGVKGTAMFVPAACRCL